MEISRACVQWLDHQSNPKPDSCLRENARAWTPAPAVGGEPAAALGTVKVRSGAKQGVIFKIKIVLLIKKYTPQDIEKPTKSMEKENITVTVREQKNKPVATRGILLSNLVCMDCVWLVEIIQHVQFCVLFWLGTPHEHVPRCHQEQTFLDDAAFDVTRRHRLLPAPVPALPPRRPTQVPHPARELLYSSHMFLRVHSQERRPRGSYVQRGWSELHRLACDRTISS